MSAEASRRKFPKPLKRSETVQEGDMPLTLFHLQGGNPLRKERSCESIDDQAVAPPKEALTPRRKALVPEQNKFLDKNEDEECNDSADSESSEKQTENVIIVPRMQIAPGDLHLYNRAISNTGGMLSEIQKATTAAQAFYAETEELRKPKSPWIFKRLYEWSHRAKAREILRHTQKALSRNDDEYQDEELKELLEKDAWTDFFGHLQLEPAEVKRLQAVWELFHSELVFLQKHLLAIRNVFKEPLKECQVEGCLLFVQPDLLFGNLEELCQVSFGFCKAFLHFLNEAKTCGNFRQSLMLKLLNKFSKGPSTVAAYQAYCINYKATMEYLETIRKTDERFAEFEKLCVNDGRCKRLQLEDLLIAPLHRITRLPILLKEILKHSPDPEEREKLEVIIDNVHDSLRSIDDSIQWLHNFERLQELQSQLVWPTIFDIEPKIFVPEFLKLALSRQFCENLLAHPRRLLIHEGILHTFENQKQVETYAFLFNDMLLLTKCKKSNQKRQKGSNPGKTEAQVRYLIQRQPVPLDSCVFCDVGPQDANVLHLKHAFVILHLTRFYQVVAVYTFRAPSKEDKECWIRKFQESIERYESIQLKDMLKCTPLVPKVKETHKPCKEVAIQTDMPCTPSPSSNEHQQFFV